MSRGPRAARPHVRAAAARATGRWTAGLLTGLLALGTVGVPAASAAPHASRRAASVTVTVTDVSPSAPTRSRTAQPVGFTLTLTNNTGTTINNVQVGARRGDPITTQAALGDTSLAPSGPPADAITVEPTSPVKVSLPAGASTQVAFSTSASIVIGDGICECADAVYPIFFLASAGGELLGAGGTYVPVAKDDVGRTRTDWLWPLIDRPHRLTGDSVFTDDLLASEVSSGGRLDRALQVVERVADDVPVTLVVDPELIDELAVMASGSYRVRSGKDSSDSTTAGTGTQAAAEWLSRLHDVLAGENSVQVRLTAFADPDIQSLVARGRTWRARMPSAMAARVTHALEGKSVGTDLTWPAGERVTRKGLAAVVDRGARQVVVSDTGLATGAADGAPAPGVVRLRAGSRAVTGLVASSVMSELVTQGVTRGSAGTRALPRLLAELSVRALQEANGSAASSSSAVLVPPRYVDPDVDAAARVIETTSSSTYTSPVGVSDLSAPSTGSDVGTPQVERSLPDSDKLPTLVFDAVDAVAGSESTIQSLLTPPRTGRTGNRSSATSAQKLLEALPTTLQRVESSAWRTRGGLSPQTGVGYAAELSDLVDSLRNGVHIVPPSTGSYTLASGNSALPVTVSNELDYPATVDVRVEAVGGLPGLTTRTLDSRTIAARTTVILRVPASIDRTARIRVRAYLTAPNGDSLGAPIVLSVRSTAFGALGVVIMSVAGFLLLLALARRWYRSARGRTAASAPTSTIGRGRP